MRSFRIEVKNDATWHLDGALKQEFCCLADDITEAFGIAIETVSQMKSRFRAAGHPDAESLRIVSVQEGVSFVGPRVSNLTDGFMSNCDRTIEQWVEDAVARFKKERSE